MLSNKEKVPIVYHYFPHYRVGVNAELSRSQRYDYIFVGAKTAENGSGVEVWKAPQGVKFQETRNLVVGRRTMLQSGLVWLALRKDVKKIIYLGCAEFLSTWCSAYIAKMAGKRVFFWTHGWTRRDEGWKAIARRNFYRLADGLLLYGNYGKSIGIEMGFKPDKLHVIYNSLDYETQKKIRTDIDDRRRMEFRERLFGPTERYIVVFTGRLVTEKRIEVLLDALRVLKLRRVSVSLIIVGEGPEMGRLREKAQLENLDVAFFGPCYDEQRLGEVLVGADLAVIPGKAGLATIHSLAYGTPVLVDCERAGQGPEWEAVIEGFNGAHFKCLTPEAIADGIMAWKSLGLERREVRDGCLRVVETFFNPHSQVRRIERALDGYPADDGDWIEFGRLARRG
jgi:glycosyltransferase involved in cell wall biosynthesis